MLVHEFLERLLGHMGVENVKIDVIEETERLFLQITVSEEDSGLIIGYHGEVLLSIQRLLRVIYREEEVRKIVVNVNDYTQRRQSQLEESVQRIAERVLETREEYVFGFLPSNERLIIHQTISQNPAYSELESVSIGEGSERRLHIRVKPTT